MHLATWEKNSLTARQLRTAAKRMLRIAKNEGQLEFVKKCAIERTHFKLAQAIFSKDFIKIKNNKYHFPDSSIKLPTVMESIEKT